MSSYFDKASGDVRDCPREPEEDFIKAVKEIENRVVHDCVLVCGDREFPEDLRQQINGHIALLTLGYENLVPSENGLNYLKLVKCSRLINQLHEDFHDVARRRIQTRFGLLCDNPKAILNNRDAFIADHGATHV